MELLTLDDIAAMYKCSKVYARDKLVKRPGLHPSAIANMRLPRCRCDCRANFGERDEV